MLFRTHPSTFRGQESWTGGAGEGGEGVRGGEEEEGGGEREEERAQGEKEEREHV